jgi:hypothetical protein
MSFREVVLTQAVTEQVIHLSIVNISPSIRTAVTVDNCHVVENYYAREK